MAATETQENAARGKVVARAKRNKTDADLPILIRSISILCEREPLAVSAGSGCHRRAAATAAASAAAASDA